MNSYEIKKPGVASNDHVELAPIDPETGKVSLLKEHVPARFVKLMRDLFQTEKEAEFEIPWCE